MCDGLGGAARRTIDATGPTLMARGAWIAIGAIAAAILGTQPAAAHIGSPDVFLDGHAGPYRLLITVRPPHAIPGIADVEVLTASDEGVQEVRIVPLPLAGLKLQANTDWGRDT